MPPKKDQHTAHRGRIGRAGLRRFAEPKVLPGVGVLGPHYGVARAEQALGAGRQQAGVVRLRIRGKVLVEQQVADVAATFSSSR